MKQFPAIAQTFILTSFSFSSLFAVPVQAAYFGGLGWLSNTSSSYANGISADGSVVVGSSKNANGYSEAFRWTQETGMVGLGFLDSNNQYKFSFANGVSADGSVVVGQGNNSGNGIEAFRWTQETGMGSLGSDTISASDVSADGSVIVGTIKADISDFRNNNEAFRLTQTDGLARLGTLGNCAFGDCPNDIRYYFFSSATTVSADGSVVLGHSEAINGLSEGFRWTPSESLVNLHSLHPNDVSADGSVIVGDISFWGNDSTEAFRLTQTIQQRLGFLSGNFFSKARGVSADGSVVVGSSGYSSNSNFTQAFRWTQEAGMVSLKETLIGEGLDLRGWSLTSANAISADGFTIVGNGTNPSGQSEAWVANLSPEPIPEPLTILGSIAAIAFAAGFERKFGKNKSEEKDPDD